MKEYKQAVGIMLLAHVLAAAILVVLITLADQ